MLFGYPSVFSLIAKLAQAKDIDLTRLGIKVVFVTSERLYPYQREMIEKVFAAPVANGYGSRDAGFIAHQCPSGSMHISAEDLVVEIVDSAGNVVPEGEKGEIVITHLATSDFPFIRYRTGDIAALDTNHCACGRGLPVLKDIEGRTTDFVVAANGTMMHGLALIYILRELDGIEAFKIIQETKHHTRVQIVPSSSQGISETLMNIIIAGFKARLGEEVIIDIEILAQIEAEKSGKFRYVISKVEA
jgi:phenylacetate-CoA ligase